MEKYFEEKLKTRFGIDRTFLMLNIMSIIDCTELNYKSNLDKLKKFINDGIKREMSSAELIGLYKGILNYVKSEPMTNERSEAVEYLLEVKFID